MLISIIITALEELVERIIKFSKKIINKIKLTRG